jgi:Right handed beta helix region
MGVTRVRLLSIALVAVGLLTAVLAVLVVRTPTAQTPPATATAPHLATGTLVPPTSVCNNEAILDSPYRYNGPPRTFRHSHAPVGLPTYGKPHSDFPRVTMIVVIPAGNNSVPANTGQYQGDHVLYYFEPGRHIIQDVMFTGDNSVFIGGYTPETGLAVIDGINGAAVGRDGGAYLSLSTTGVANADDTWEYLTIKNFTASQNNAIMGNENGSGFDNGNTYKYDTIGPNEYGYAGNGRMPNRGESSGGGYAIGAGNNTTIEYDCLTRNAQGAFNGGGVNDVVSHNEISWNGLGEYPDGPGTGGSPYSCGCSGGGKLVFSVNPVITYNYVHNNYNAGIWLDFDNTGANISYNYVASNWGVGISYEASYNANISHNTLVGNGWASDGAWPAGVHGGTCYNGISCTLGSGPITGAGGGFPYSAISLSNSGGNRNLQTVKTPGCSTACSVKSDYNGELLVEDNKLLDNFGGISVYTDTNRYPGNIDNDSACSIPLGAMNQPNNPVYYQQSKELYTDSDSTISGTRVTSVHGTTTLCANYAGPQEDSGQSNVVKPPLAGMAVFNINTGKFIGTVASVTSAHAFTLAKPTGNASKTSLLLSAYGGCGPADYFGGNLGIKSGKPAAYYWDNCIWGSRNIRVSGNQFQMQQNRVMGCDETNMCGFMTDVAFNAGVPSLMQFFRSYATFIAYATRGLNDVWADNYYSWTGSDGEGQWQFWAGLQGTQITQAEWTSPPYSQDVGSRFADP